MGKSLIYFKEKSIKDFDPFRPLHEAVLRILQS